eukprot:2587016-Prymnesium_polylepis.1
MAAMAAMAAMATRARVARAARAARAGRRLRDGARDDEGLVDALCLADVLSAGLRSLLRGGKCIRRTRNGAGHVTLHLSKYLRK